MSLRSGARLGPYEIVELIGSGGMGEVYRAVDSRLARDVAIKILPPRLADHSESLLRFRREARAVAALSHPNILSVFDIGNEGDRPYVVTELLTGQTLRARMEQGVLPLDEALRVGAAIAAGLGAAHEKGIIHRDLKPENVFLTTSGGVKILDFGLASTQRPLGDASGSTATIGDALTEPGLVIGTIGYMSPEQLRGEALTTASDVFSFGCLAFEMLQGEMPFRRDSNIEVVAAVLRDDPFANGAGTAPRKPIPDEVHEVLERCLAKEPRDRPPNGNDVKRALDAAVVAHQSGWLPTARTSRVRWRRMRRGAGTLSIAAMVMATLVALAAWRFTAPQREVIDGGYDLRASDITGTSETRRLTALALRADADGSRAEAIELLREASRLDARSPLPPAFLSAFVYYNGDPKGGLRMAAETRKRVSGPSSTYETLLSRYLLPDNEGATQMALASSLLELRPKAWRLRLSLAHRHLDRREMPAMLEQLKQIDVSAPDDRRLAIVLADRASLGDVAGATRDLHRGRLMSRPALLAYTEGRIAWSRGKPAEAAKRFDAAADSATTANLLSVAIDSRVLAGMARVSAGDLAAAEAALDLAALKAHQAALPSSELEAYAFGAYVAWRLGDPEGMRRRLKLALALGQPGLGNVDELRLFILRTGAALPIPPSPSDADSEDHGGLTSLLAARQAWAQGDPASAARLLRQARAEGVDSTWFAEEAALLGHDLGEAPRPFRADPPYPNRLRFLAVWELTRPPVAMR